MYSAVFKWLLLLSLVVIAGCQTTTGFYRGARADDETVVSLQKIGQDEHHWQDLYVRLDFRTQQQGGEILFDGVFTFANFPRMNLARVDDFKLKLFFLDRDQLVLDYFDIYRTFGGSLEEEMLISRSLLMPAGTVAFAFGYEGEFFDEIGARKFAWKLPRKSF